MSRRTNEGGAGRWAGVAVMGVVVALAFAPEAVAQSAPRYPMKAAQTVRVDRSTQAAKWGSVRAKELVEVQCQDRGASVGGSTLWDYIQYDVDGTKGQKKRGWVPDYYVRTGSTDPLPGIRQGDCPPPAETGPDAPPPSPHRECTPTPPPAEPRLTVGIPRGSSATPRSVVTTRYGRTVTIQGRLATSAGAPLAGARVCVATQIAARGAALSPGTFVLTDGQGAFSYDLGAGPSRWVSFMHTTHEGTVSGKVLVRARAPVMLRASRHSLRNGETLVLGGRLRGGPGHRGVLVELQSRRGSGWQTFKSIHARRDGRFRYAYRFQRTYDERRFQMRAHVPAQSGYPYATGASRTVHVRVSG